MFERIREDYVIHGRSLASRTWWAMVHYRYGRWAASLSFPPARWLAG